MTEANISAYDKFIVDSAEQYLRTVVLIDDRIYEKERGSVASHLAKSPAGRRKSALKSVTPSSDKSSKKIEKTEVPEEPDEVSFHDVQNSFAKKRIICSLYQPKKRASFGEQSEVYKLCSTADVVIVDWDLHGDSGDKATTLVGNLVAQSQAEMPYQLRLVLIYTLDPNLQSVANTIFKHLLKLLSEDVTINSQYGGLVLTTENARVVVLGKRENTTLTQFSDYWVPETDLATRTIREFSRLASGLLQGIILRGIAKIRENNRRILTRFHKDSDIAFLTHRALSLPNEAFGQIIPLLSDELHAVLEDTLGESPLGKATTVKEILDGWCDKHWTMKKNAELNIGDGANGLEFVKDVFCNGPAIKKDYSKVQKSQIPYLIKNNKWYENKSIKLAEYLSGDCKIDHCHEKLGSLMSQRVKYDNAGRSLHLGVIVRELADKKRYLLCLQPVCDSVRIEGETRAFVFCVLQEPKEGKVLKKPKEGKHFTHCVMDGGGNMIKLEYKPKVSSIFVSNFKSADDAVYADKDKTDDIDKLVFKDEDAKKYEWIAELKAEHAQRAAEQFGREFSRVGLTESEWLRIKAK